MPCIRDRLALPYLPEHIRHVLQSFEVTSMRPILVGGCVRDACLERPIKEYDVEVFGCEGVQELMNHLRTTCKQVSYVGQSFGVFKVGVDLELSIPRKDNKVGTKHTDFSVEFLPCDTSFSQAAQRRDLTVNSMGYDPLSEELHDPYNGREDLKKRQLRCVDPQSFGEDPLRPWRALQFASRLHMKPDQALCTLSRGIVLDIASERVYAELKKWFQSGNDLVQGWQFFVGAQLGRYFPQEEHVWREPAIQETLRNAFECLQSYVLDNDAMMTIGAVSLFWPCVHFMEALSFLNAPTAMIRRVDGLRHLWALWRTNTKMTYELVGAFLRIESLGVAHATLEALGSVLSVCEDVQASAWEKILAHWNDIRGQSHPIVQGRDICALGVPSGCVVGRMVALCHKMQVEEGITDKAILLRRVKQMLGGTQ